VRASGRDLGDWSFCVGLAHLELAVIAEGIAHRTLAGADAGPNAARAAEESECVSDADLAARS
jgi:aminoglycoside phosphotransferase (APT) family kinase protein